ncbi:hypothetical protein BG09_5106 [Bacillus thuringiensis serovar kurstaki str. HD-1]|nr:hypothetical protein BG09_5106 [Bacillus thuringiensis serovar kurstaki str. HD-1]
MKMYIFIQALMYIFKLAFICDMEFGKRRSFFKKNASKRMGFTKV